MGTTRNANAMNNHYRKASIFSSLALCALAGCRVGPVYHQPQATAQAPPAVYKETPSADSDAWKPAQPQDAMLRDRKRHV